MNENNLGSLWKRVGGAAIDFAIVMLLVWIAVYAWAAFIVANQSDIGMDSETQKEMWKARGLIIGLGIDFLYCVLLQGGSRQRTLGQQVFSLKLAGLNGETITYPRAAARYFVSLISSIVIKLGFLSAVFNKNKQTFHDLVAGTVVISDADIQEKFEQVIQQPYRATNDHYAIALKEFESEGRQLGLWARCYADAKGDESKAKAAYIELRAIELLEHRVATYHDDQSKDRSVLSDKSHENDENITESKSAYVDRNSENVTKLLLKWALIPVVIVLILVLIANNKSDLPDIKNENTELTDNGEIFHNAMRRRESGSLADGVNYIRKFVGQGVIAQFDNNLINESIENEPNDISSYKLGDILEANEIWWRDKKKTLNIAIYNPSTLIVSQIRFELYPYKNCESKIPSETKSFTMRFEKQLTYKTMHVYTFELPFEWNEWAVKGNGSCLIIKKAW